MKSLFLFSFILISQLAQAESVSLREFQTPVKDQGDRNTCAYFAVTAMMESFIKTRFDKEFDISEQFQIYYGKTQFKQYADKEFGSTYEIALNFRNQNFFITEADIPYKNSLFEPGQTCSSQDPFDPTAPALCFSQGPYDSHSTPRVRFDGLDVNWLTNLWSFNKTRTDLIIDEIRKGHSVVITLKVFPETWEEELVTYDDEIHNKCESGVYACAGHAVLLVGFDTETKEFLFKNSWGESWGDRGYGRASFDYVERFSDMPITMQWRRNFANLRE